jgi:hypothetical protein
MYKLIVWMMMRHMAYDMGGMRCVACGIWCVACGRGVMRGQHVGCVCNGLQCGRGR